MLDPVTDTATFALYAGNDLVYSLGLTDFGVSVVPKTVLSEISLPLTVPAASLTAYLLTVVYPIGNYTTFKVWAITPQILNGMHTLEAFLNKAQIKDTIPELQYAQSDLLLYLERGLNLFNMLGTQVTNFNGTNMQGVLFDAWVTCASYYALASQLQAEGALAFDFSGQSVSLSVDRTGQLDSALGRIEGQINDQIKPYKNLLIKSGVTGGDGSAGAKTLGYGQAFGVVGLTNAPTTRIAYGGTSSLRRFR